MYKTTEHPKSISDKTKRDPSEIKQEFSNISLKVLCCRYWILREWNCSDLSVPFWRIYHNNIAGAQISFKGETIALDKETLVIIPPNTSFSSKFSHGAVAKQESIIGRKCEETDSLAHILANNSIDHLFIHFSLGSALDFVKSNIYTIPCNKDMLALIEDIQTSCLSDINFSFIETLRIKQLITSSLVGLKDHIWKMENMDPRIFDAIRTIDRKFGEGISNAQLADNANMAINSFARLFKNVTGYTVQYYITKIRVEAACDLMHHSNKNIDEIAYTCGFFDRHHFSKIFKKVMKVNPSYYMKNLTIG